MNLGRRKAVNAVMLALAGLGTAVVLMPLAMILATVLREGVGGTNLAFLTQLPAPPGSSGGGMANAIVGTIELLVLASAIGVPLGLAGGLYLAEMGGEGLAAGIRLAADVLNGVPTIVTGLFVYAVVVAPMRRFSLFAGGLALAAILTPVALRASEEVLRAVPKNYREAAIALGASRWRMLRDVILRAAKSGLIGAALLGVARVAGETAPLLLTSLNSTQWNLRPDQPTASLTVQVFDYAIAPYNDWHRQAWAGALTLLVLVLALNLGARAWGREREAA